MVFKSDLIQYFATNQSDFAFSSFLDKFAFKNPKSLDRLSKQLKRRESIAERKSGLSGNMALPMNDPSYLESRKIPEEDKFFHKFFVERAKRDQIKGIIRGSCANKDKNDYELEEKALDATEANEADETFGNLEDTDSEEEAFVNQLAENLMESTANSANLDEEDPDMDDWIDFEDSDSKQVNGNFDDEDHVSEDGNKTPFMGKFSSNDSDEENMFCSIDGEKSINENLYGDSNLLSFGEDGFDNVSRTQAQEGFNTKNKRKNPFSIYADAEEYEKILEEESKRHLKEYGDKFCFDRKEKKKIRKKH